MDFRLAHRAIFCSSLLAAASLAFAQNGPVHGIFEQYIDTDTSHTGVQGILSYLRLNADLSPSVSLVGSIQVDPDDRWLDEVYAQYQDDRNIYKLGRIRADFGLNSWSDLYYTPFIGLPMIRTYDVSVVPGISLYQLDRGAEIEGSRGAFQYQVSVVDPSDDDWHIIPGHVNTGIGRFQFSGGPFIVGLNGFAKIPDSQGPSQQILGIDFRYSAPRLLVRAEAIRGLGSSGASGYYADVFYRPPKLARTQVGFRAQGIDTPSTSEYSWDDEDEPPTSDRGHLYSFGVRQFLNENFTLSVNYGTGDNIPETRGLTGWSVQLQSTFRF